ncbi:hypothetical protein JIN85_07055 [Luteolibacter pohnpeiensis]|uniref:Uncharacterized protein n=1 Tax=Luteolibacter pohnpeiensis TaxID=454153 RepID=A0A934S6I9_9BACT|nr:hypothetical protein [Luteolibacter pohnpeiensis]MBK1882165.1 hypothetical protein [Luteolibacter pohnpeiensis]
MRLPIFLSSATIIALGFFAMRFLERAPATGFLTGALQLGGGLLICGLFAIRSQTHWHGVIGAGVVSLLGAARGLANVAKLPGYFSGTRHDGPAPLFESSVALICVILMFRVLRYLQAERLRRMLEEDDAKLDS